MNKIFSSCIFLLSFLSFSQNNIEICGTHKILEKQLKDPKFKNKFEANRLLIQQSVNQMKNQPLQRGTVYTIPVVFHVLHNGGPENISKEQIEDALFILNRDYRKQNNDINNVHPAFQSIAADIEVEFKLATKAPDGTCFGGITRTQSQLSNSDNGWEQVGAIVEGNDVYQGEWPGDMYLNIFVCGEIGNGAAGYTYLPGSIGNSMYNGIWVLDEYVGSIGTSEVGRSRVLTHEVGHWLDLPHTWGYTNDPGLASNCDSDDDIFDTPNTIGATWCNLNQSACGVLANVENYMDYSYCSKMFTEGQKERMRGTLNSFVDGRNNLITTQNLIETGANEELYLCRAYFISDRKEACVGETIQFNDASYNRATSWTWFFEGGTPQTSIAQNPNVIYQNSGTFDVKLVVSDGEYTDSITFSNYITISEQPVSLPFFEGFEAYTTLNNHPFWKIDNPQNNQTFAIRSDAGSSGTKSAFISNFSQFGVNTDELISSSIDLSDITSQVTLSFRYSYKKRPSVDNEKLQVLVSSDCGQTWSLKRTLSGTILSDGETNLTWVPTQYEDWKTAHVTNILSNSWSENFMFKFRFLGERGNNVYIDDINLYSGPPNDSLFIKEESQAKLYEENINSFVNIYPNPTSGEFTINFNQIQTENELKIELYNALGQSIELNNLSNDNLKHTYRLNQISKGIYTIKIILNDNLINKKLIIE